MECNRDEALRATELAEKKLAVRDLAGAKKFALKAMHLFPGLDRAKQLLLVVEVHAAAELKCDDWYGILQVDPVADVDFIKKQFRKLALQLHPDKNNLQGAEQAFKLINEAWGVLSDKVRRAVYDVKRNAAAVSQPAADANGYNHGSAASDDAAKVHQQQQPSVGESAPPPSGRQQPPGQAPRQGPLSSKGGSSAATSSSQGQTSSTQAQDTFWTQCPRCRVQYQYYRTYENFQLLCQRCKEGFVAKDMNVALARGKNKQQESDLPRGSSGKSRVNGVKSENFIQLMQQKAREREEKRLEDERRKMEREKEREEKRRLKEALKKLKEEEKRREAMERQIQKQREREEKEARKRSMEALKRKLKRSRMQEEDDDDDEEEDEEEEEEEVAAAQAAALGRRRSHRTRKNVVYRDDIYEEDGQAAKKARAEELNLSEEELAFRKHLAEKGRQYVLKALSEMLKNKSGQAAAAEEQEVQVTQKEACPVTDVKATTTPAAVETPDECVQNQNCSEVPQSTSSDESESDAVFFVPDSDFYDFDKDRREEDVQERQIWALYDDADGMPRFYCEIKQVVSRTPFKLRIRWLEQHQPSEMEQKWQEAGFQMTCGRFKLAKRAKPEDQINKFSHAIIASKIQGNVVWVYPVKGEVWALYRDWSTEWLQQGIDAEAASRGGYEMVEVVGDGSWAAAASSEAAEVAEEGREEIFVTVVNLVKVHGFRTIFARGQGAERTFKRQKLLRFSHRVPAHWMTGDEKPNAPKDCWQLDTAAMPSHLINEAGD